MTRISNFLVAVALITAPAEQAAPAPKSSPNVMIVAVSRDSGVLVGGISGPVRTSPGRLSIEPLAWLDPSGNWKSLDCDSDRPDNCLKFEREYLSKPHRYTIVGAPGQGADVEASPTHLDDYFGFTGYATYSGAPILDTSIAASSADYFSSPPPIRTLLPRESPIVRAALTALIPSNLESLFSLRIRSVQLEGKEFVVIQRSFREIGLKGDDGAGRLRLIFAIGTMQHGRFHTLVWKRNVMDEDELVLGTIRMKNAREYLITSVRDPESQSFRIYGIRNGELKLVYSGGGASC